jgi:cyclopropane fatty-acyl-phospholipid synthase-like methyltransferase
LYRLWSPLYDLSLKLDPGYAAGVQRMVDAVVFSDSTVLDIGCGTGIATIPAAKRANRAIAVDPSSEMLSKLRKKMRRQWITNVELLQGFFPEALASTAVFDVVISSFAIVHIERDTRKGLYQAVFNHLRRNGCIGTFGARGVIAAAFETREEILHSLGAAGFENVEVTDISDIYRIITAVKK